MIPVLDPISQERVYGCSYPRSSDLVYGLRADLAVGGIVGYDTLVSWGEFFPDPYKYGAFTFQSQDISNPSLYSHDALSALDIVCEFIDTFPVPGRIVGPDPYRYRDHIPLNLKVRQRSMAWSGGVIGEFILVEFDIMNIGSNTIQDIYVGLQYDTDVFHASTPHFLFANDDYPYSYAGILQFHPQLSVCGLPYRADLAYIMSRDGTPADGQYDDHSPLDAVGLAILKKPADGQRLSFNWMYDRPGWQFGGTLPFYRPRLSPPPGGSLRDMERLYDWWWEDEEVYYRLSNAEIDYDCMLAALDHTGDGWLPPPSEAEARRIAGGAQWELQASLALGPYPTLGPGQVLNFAVAIVAGDSVHHDPTAFERRFNPYNPWPFYNQLDFSNLAENTRWARWVYDNPGYDTDGDGYRGEFRICEGDTFWYEGDGIPDFRADLPPPAPPVTVTPTTNKLVIRWNGFQSENHIDPFTQTQDFEGYRVYVGLDSRRASLSLLASYDREDYNRFKLIQRPNGDFVWVTTDLPFTLDSLKVIYNNPQFDPLVFTKLNPLVVNDTLYRFEKQDFNQFDLGVNSASGIHKAYPEAPDPGVDTTLWTEDDLTHEHGSPLPKYYEYEYVYDNLLATIPYYVSVTAFDFGFAKGGIPAKESNPLSGIIEAFAQVSADTVEALQLDAYVYPNPYRADEDYLERGFENRDRSGMRSRARRIHFGNLPNVCKISIYSLDGDLVRELDHNYPEGGPNAMHESWDFITRNAMLVMPGLYYYVIESEGRTQIGKFVIIM